MFKRIFIVIKKLTKKFLIPFVLSCIVLGLGFLLVGIVGLYGDYKKELPYTDIESARNLMHEASNYALTYSQKMQAISEVYGNVLIRSKEGLETLRLYKENLENNLTKSVELTKQAQEKDPHIWNKLTELINKRVDEKQQLYVLDKEFYDNMQKVYDEQMTESEWNNYLNNVYPVKITAWNKLNQDNTNFNIANNIEENPEYTALDYATVKQKYKPTLKGFMSDFWKDTPEESTESYEDSAPFPIISRVYDSVGNMVKVSEFNKYVGPEKYKNNISSKPLKVGDYIFITAEPTDLVERKMYYLFTSNSLNFNSSYGQIRGKETYTEAPYFIYKVTSSDIKNTDGNLRIEVKISAEGNTHRVQEKNYDDSAYLEYPLIE